MRFYLTMALVLLLGGCSLVLWAVSAQANDLNFGFKNPSFHSGNGYSSHVLSMEQLRFTRKKERKEQQICEQPHRKPKTETHHHAITYE